MILQGYNAQALIRNLRDTLSHQFGLRYYVRNYERNGHALFGSNNPNNKKLYVIFKRDFFITFNKQFVSFSKQYPEYYGEGESINTDALNRAIKFDCEYIVFIHDTGVFVAYPMLIKNFCETHKLIRGQKRLNSIYANGTTEEHINEITYSFPKKLLIPIEDIITNLK